MYDKCLPFGLSSACSIFQRVSDALAHLVSSKTDNPVVNYLDDFFFADQSYTTCKEQLDTFTRTMDTVGFPWAPEKTALPAQEMEFLGLGLNSKKQTITIPEDKIKKTKTLIEDFLQHRTRRVKQCQALAGTLNFLSKAIVPGRAFTRRLYDAIPKNRVPDHHVNVSAAVKKDLTVWLQMIAASDCHRPFMDFTVQKAESLGIYTDASGSAELGLGCVWQNPWISLQWPSGYIRKPGVLPSIAFLELYAIAVAVLKWGHTVANMRVQLESDNQSAVAMVNNNTSKCPHCMVLVRHIVLHSMKYNFRIFAEYKPGKDNILADSLSRLDYKTFTEHAPPGMDTKASQPPEKIWPPRGDLDKFKKKKAQPKKKKINKKQELLFSANTPDHISV